MAMEVLVARFTKTTRYSRLLSSSFNSNYFLSSSSPPSPLRTLPTPTSSSSSRPFAPGIRNPSPVWEILRILQENGPELVTRLSRMKIPISTRLVEEVLRRSDGSASFSVIRFFNWAKTQPGFRANSSVYAVFIDFCGRIRDFNSIEHVMKELSLSRYYLKPQAFDFLARTSSLGDSVLRVLEIGKSIGGSFFCLVVHVLVIKLIECRRLSLAISAMEKSVNRTSYCNAMIAALCEIGRFEEARRLIDDMKRFGCEPTVNSYNYLLGSLFKRGRIKEGVELMEKMESFGCLPDNITYEIVACHACRIGKIDCAMDLLDRMMKEGLKPRLLTYALFVKSYFYSGQAVEARNFVKEMSVKDGYSANVNYSLLASLYWKERMFDEAGSVLVELMAKGLKPNFSVYVKVVKDLRRSGKGDIADDLRFRFERFRERRTDDKGG